MDLIVKGASSLINLAINSIQQQCILSIERNLPKFKRNANRIPLWTEMGSIEKGEKKNITMIRIPNWIVDEIN